LAPVVKNKKPLLLYIEHGNKSAD